MAWPRSGLGIAFEVDQGDLCQAPRLEGLQVNDARYGECAWLGGLDVEGDDIALRIQKWKCAFFRLV